MERNSDSSAFGPFSVSQLAADAALFTRITKTPFCSSYFYSGHHNFDWSITRRAGFRKIIQFDSTRNDAGLGTANLSCTRVATRVMSGIPFKSIGNSDWAKSECSACFDRVQSFARMTVGCQLTPGYRFFRRPSGGE